MIPVICYSFFNPDSERNKQPEPGYRIYLRSTLAQSSDNLKATHGIQYDKVERTKVSGGIPQRWVMLPTLFKSMDEALASIKTI